MKLLRLQTASQIQMTVWWCECRSTTDADTVDRGFPITVDGVEEEMLDTHWCNGEKE